MAENKLGQAIHLSAQDYFPIPLSRMVLDFAVVGEAQGENGPELELLVVAARTADLEKSLAALQLNRLKPLARLTGTGRRQMDWLLKLPDFCVSTGLALRGLDD